MGKNQPIKDPNVVKGPQQNSYSRSMTEFGVKDEYQKILSPLEGSNTAGSEMSKLWSGRSSFDVGARIGALAQPGLKTTPEQVYAGDLARQAIQDFKSHPDRDNGWIKLTVPSNLDAGKVFEAVTEGLRGSYNAVVGRSNDQMTLRIVSLKGDVPTAASMEAGTFVNHALSKYKESLFPQNRPEGVPASERTIYSAVDAKLNGQEVLDAVKAKLNQYDIHAELVKPPYSNLEYISLRVDGRKDTSPLGDQTLSILNGLQREIGKKNDPAHWVTFRDYSSVWSKHTPEELFEAVKTAVTPHYKADFKYRTSQEEGGYTEIQIRVKGEV